MENGGCATKENQESRCIYKKAERNHNKPCWKRCQSEEAEEGSFGEVSISPGWG